VFKYRECEWKDSGMREDKPSASYLPIAPKSIRLFPGVLARYCPEVALQVQRRACPLPENDWER
jgi:hypothetical protein